MRSLLLLFPLFFLLPLAACVFTPQNQQEQQPVEPPPEPIAGTNRRIRCDENCRVRCALPEVEETTGVYSVKCYAVTIVDGTEFKVDEATAGIRLEWSDPQRISGGEIIENSCQVARDDLSQACSVRVAQVETATEVKVDLKISDNRDLAQPKERVESERVTLYPVKVKSLFFYPQAPILFDLRLLDGPSAANPKDVAFGFSPQRFPLTGTNFGNIQSLCFRGQNLYFSVSNHIFVANGGEVSLFAGSTNEANGNDLSHARRVAMWNTIFLACAPDGVYASDSGNHRILKFLDNGSVVKFAGGNGSDFSGDGGPAALARLHSPRRMALRKDGVMFFADNGNNRVRKIDSNGIITTMAGTGTNGFSGDGGPATAARLASPSDAALTENGSLLIADSGNGRIRRVNPQGVITTVAGGGTSEDDNIPAVQASIPPYEGAVLVAPAGAFYFIAGNSVKKVNAQGLLSTIAGKGPNNPGDGGPALTATLRAIFHLAWGPDGSIHIAEYTGGRVRRIDAAGIIHTVLGDFQTTSSGDGGPAESARMTVPSGIAIASDGSILVADVNNHRIRKITPNGVTSTVAGNGSPGFSGDGGPAVAARLFYPRDVAIASDGAIYIVDSANHRIRKIDGSGIITTVAGIGENGFSGDGGPAIAARFAWPQAIAVTAGGVIFVADADNVQQNARIRKIDLDGIVTTYAGNGTASNVDLKEGQATAVGIYPMGIVVDGAGNVFFSDYYANRIRKIDTTGFMTTIAGKGPGSTTTGDDGLATAATLGFPRKLAIDNTGKIYFAERSQLRVLEPQSSGQYIIRRLMGAGPQDCGRGVIEAEVPRGEVREKLKASLAAMCTGHVVSVAVRRDCREGAGTSLLVIGQSFGQSGHWGNLLTATGTCH